MSFLSLFGGDSTQQVLNDLLSNVNFAPQRNIGSGSGYMTNSQKPTQTSEQTAQQEKKDEVGASVGVGVGGGSGSGGAVAKNSTDSTSMSVNLQKYIPYTAVALGVVLFITVIFKFTSKKGKKR
jgi:hypothetical protein